MTGQDNDAYMGGSQADIMPSAMECESYDDGVGKGRGAGSASASSTAVAVQEPQTGCWHSFTRGIRSLWATKMTEDTDENPELKIKTTLRELIIYLVFIAVLCCVTFGMTSQTMYYYTKVMTELFLDSSFKDTGNTFRGMTTMQDWFRFAEGPLMDGLYWETWYNDRNVSQDELGYIFYENKLLGVPRMRQLKVRNDSCTVHDDFKEQIKACYDSYGEAIEEKNPFGKMNGSAWTYQTEEELDGSGHWGQLATYAGSGYVQDLDTTKAASLAIINDLKNNLWLDRGTRAVFVDFSVYNANINLFCVVRLLVEFPATGGAIPSWTFRTVKLLRYVNAMDYFVMACEMIFMLFIIYYMVEEGIEIKKHKLSYFKGVWNCMDIFIIVVAWCCAAFSLYRLMSVSSLLETLLENPNKYPDFEFLSYCEVMYSSTVAIMVFFAWVKVFKYISFNKTMTQLSSTLAACAKDLAGFAVMFFIIFLAFAQLGYLIFGTQVQDFSSFGTSIFTLFRIILGDFDFHALEEANRVLGPAYFILYVFFVFFVLINMFLAIINDTYSEVKADLENQKNEFEMGDYFKKGYNKMLDKLNVKRDKIVDIQKALASADLNNDKHVDFDEWRQNLKTRGYAEAEIEAVFAKYDLDGDRVLDDEEVKKMQQDLVDQRAEMDKEIGAIEDDGSKQRSQSRASFEGDSADESDDEESGKRRGRNVNGVSYDEFMVLSRRVDRMEHSIGSIVSKIDAVLVKLEAMERAKSKRRETMSKILDSITENDGTPDNQKREQMEKLVRDELERWDSESSIGNSAGSGVGRRSRPSSGAGNHAV
jgi:polycystin 2